ncbi:hypothetical protein ACHAW5_010896 [Stephanodiscus triporus]|uniref:Uncharacterized protein n=1 Tax=Stephanodiscus triporus TaxID=2934178 RepID=A0ABD3P2K2_9STRA
MPALNLSGLNAVFHSNHTCYLDFGKDTSSRINNLADSKMNRKVKLMAVLSPHKERYTNVLFLGDVSGEIMPSVLFYLQKEVGLDAVFQLISEWHMNLLYTSHIPTSTAQENGCSGWTQYFVSRIRSSIAQVL